MSTTVMAACWPLQLPPTPKAVLISLADNANDQGECWPSIATICERTCYGRTAVIDAIKVLEAQQLLVADRTNGRHTRYRITVTLDLFRSQPVRQTDRSASRTGPAAGPHPSASRTAPVRQADTNRQEPSITKSEEQQRAEAGRTSDAADGRRGTRLPDGWEPSEAVREWARSEFPAVSLDTALAEFADYWSAVPGQRGRKLDWDATFRNRVREIAARLPRSSHAATHRESAAERVARRNAEAGQRTHGRVIDGDVR